MIFQAQCLCAFWVFCWGMYTVLTTHTWWFEKTGKLSSFRGNKSSESESRSDQIGNQTCRVWCVCWLYHGIGVLLLLLLHAPHTVIPVFQAECFGNVGFYSETRHLEFYVFCHLPPNLFPRFSFSVLSLCPHKFRSGSNNPAEFIHWMVDSSKKTNICVICTNFKLELHVCFSWWCNVFVIFSHIRTGVL